jgi:alpha-L-fucosidase
MKIKIDRIFLVMLLAWLVAVGVQAAELPVAPGPFQPTMASLTNYSCPEWFRDAKFGIWAHWGPQAVPMEGDWYARKMYQQGSPDYQDHLARYGHPSTNGWKDIIPLWKAEQWEPKKLMALYKKAGARYFVSMGSHHDDFFLWNSSLHKWNAVNYGPHRDVVGDWQKAAKEQGLPFGVSEHLGASFTWFQDSHKSDHTGPLAGVPYDGANSNYWDLYHFPAEKDDTKWYSNNPRWQQQWFNEIKELVDNYHPDLLYSDGPVPFGNEVGLSLIADLYNDSVRHNRAEFMACYNCLPPRLREQYELERRVGKLTAVYNCKQPSDGRWVQDFERGVNGGINPHPWQTDTSIGDWFYNRHWKYQPLSWTVHMLVDIVSKNGNLLLNVVLRPDGSLDPEVETMLHQLADWTAVNGEAIYGTRPWLVFGEGPTQAKGGAFKENFQYTARDIRFTTKGKTLYAIALGWPDGGKLTIKSLAQTGDTGMNKIKRVELLGHKGKLQFEQTTEGLIVTLPAAKLSDLTCSLKITGSNLKPAIPPVTGPVVRPDLKDDVFLPPPMPNFMAASSGWKPKGGLPDIRYWDKGDEWVSWAAHIEWSRSFRMVTRR